MWKYIKEEHPALGKKVLVFRDDKSRYSIGRFTHEIDEYGYHQNYWVTEYGSMHKVVPEDQWLEFEYAVKMKVCE